MSGALRTHPSSRSLSSEFSRELCREFLNSLSFSRLPFSSISMRICSLEVRSVGGETLVLSALRQERSLEELNDSPVSIELQPICSDTQFDRIIGDAQHHGDTILIVWMACWCRKCIYLKPQLEKLAAEYHPRLRFYCVDVNAVTHKLVARAGVTKMPIIQLWKNGKKQAEVNGGHKAYLVINEIREIIENECSI